MHAVTPHGNTIKYSTSGACLVQIVLVFNKDANCICIFLFSTNETTWREKCYVTFLAAPSLEDRMGDVPIFENATKYGFNNSFRCVSMCVNV